MKTDWKPVSLIIVLGLVLAGLLYAGTHHPPVLW